MSSITITTGRFNNETWNICKLYREKNNISCIYSPPYKLSASIELNSPVFIIEMNNSTNKILGIGLIKNKLVTDKIYKVQKDTNCNRYIYIGNHHISRELLEFYNPLLVNILDEILFKGYTHSKRGSGITKIPEKVLTLEICKNINIKHEIKTIFINHYKNHYKNTKKYNKKDFN